MLNAHMIAMERTFEVYQHCFFIFYNCSVRKDDPGIDGVVNYRCVVRSLKLPTHTCFQNDFSNNTYMHRMIVILRYSLCGNNCRKQRGGAGCCSDKY